MRKSPCVYILASARNGTLYIGVTSDLAGRVSVHVQDLVPGFTAKHSVHCLVYYEMHETMEAAIAREKQLNGWIYLTAIAERSSTFPRILNGREPKQWSRCPRFPPARE
jgi:putative endonuclease